MKAARDCDRRRLCAFGILQKLEGEGSLFAIVSQEQPGLRRLTQWHVCKTLETKTFKALRKGVSTEREL
jgi:hypothetical protein